MPSERDADTHALANTVMARCDALAAFTEEPGRITRRYASPQMREVNATVGEWMRTAGMTVRQDAVGNLIGRYSGEREDAPVLLLGSHLDSVRDAGRYDGILGVLVALALVERLHTRGQRLPFAVEVLGFADEEGLRYRMSYLGSAAAAGVFDPAWLARQDDDGIPLADAIRAFGGDPARLSERAWRSDEPLGYVEVHIEQGPVLEQRGYPVGVVSAIQGQSGIGVTLTGVAGHAGTVPMGLRHDALAAGAEFALAVESLARQMPGLVATVGRFQVAPGASNVIPGHAALSLDVRHPDDQVRLDAVDRLRERAEGIAQRRSVQLGWHAGAGQATVTCSPRLTSILARAISDAGNPVHNLPSGAGHDGAIMSQITEIAMLFVRCKGGVSHSPLESVAAEDVAVALDVLERVVMSLAEERASGGGV